MSNAASAWVEPLTNFRDDSHLLGPRVLHRAPPRARLQTANGTLAHANAPKSSGGVRLVRRACGPFSPGAPDVCGEQRSVVAGQCRAPTRRHLPAQPAPLSASLRSSPLASLDNRFFAHPAAHCAASYQPGQLPASRLAARSACSRAIQACTGGSSVASPAVPATIRPTAGGLPVVEPSRRRASPRRRRSARPRSARASPAPRRCP